MSDVIARTSGTTDATIAPNANSRMMNVSGMVSLSDSSRSLEMSSVMSSLMNVKLTTWMRQVRVRGTGLVHDRPDRLEERPRPAPTRRGPAPTIRTVVPSGADEAGLGRRQERVDQLVEARRVTPRRASALGGPELGDEVADRGLERRVRRRARRRHR